MTEYRASAKLDAVDRELVGAQDLCVVLPKTRLGALGPPIKIDVQGQTVFLCCAVCKKRALSDPDKTLARLTRN